MRAAFLLGLILLAAPQGRAAEDAEQDNVYDCAEPEDLNAFALKMKALGAKKLGELGKKKLALTGDPKDARRCSVADWCLHQKGKVKYDAKTREAISAPARKCEEPFIGDCRSDTDCEWRSAPLETGKPDSGFRVVLHEGKVQVPTGAPVEEGSSGNTGDFEGLRLTANDRVYKVQMRTNIILRREGNAGALKDTGADFDPDVKEKVCFNLGLKCPSENIWPCDKIGLTKDKDEWVDARGGRWRMNGIMCDRASAKPSDPTRQLIGD